MARVLFLDTPESRGRHEERIRRIHEKIVPELTLEFDEIRRQFVEDDLVYLSGPRKGEPLGEKSRRLRITKMLNTHDRMRELEAEALLLERHLNSLEQMEWRQEHEERETDEPGRDPEEGA